MLEFDGKGVNAYGPDHIDSGWIELRCEHCGQSKKGTDISLVIAMYMAHIVHKHMSVIEAAQAILAANPKWDWRK
jgi:hypothetical protein